MMRKGHKMLIAASLLSLLGFTQMTSAQSQIPVAANKPIVQKGGTISGSHTVNWGNGNSTTQNGTAIVSPVATNSSGQSYISIQASGTVKSQ